MDRASPAATAARQYGRLAAAALLSLFLACSPGMARPLTAEESDALAARVAAYHVAMRAADFDAIIGVVPPKLVNHLAAMAGVSTSTLVGLLVDEMKDLFASVTIESYAMDLAAAEHRELADGEPYVFIPTTTKLNAGEGVGRLSMESRTLGLLDGGDWYLLRVADEATARALRQVYPAFGGVEFPAETTTPR